MDDTILHELLERDEEISVLNNRVYQLSHENDSMKKTIDIILRVNCKRGEGAFSLNTDLKTCVSNNITQAFTRFIRECYIRKASDLVVDILLYTLVGIDGKCVPCAIMDTNTIVYKDNDLWIATNLQKFTDILHNLLRDRVIAIYQDSIDIDIDTGDDTFVNVMNTLLQMDKFKVCLKRMLKLYKLF
jgi:hypothetical protein